MTDISDRFDYSRGSFGGFTMAPLRRAASFQTLDVATTVARPAAAGAIDEEARWRAYQAWLRKNQARAAPETASSQSVVVAREPLEQAVETVGRTPEFSSPATPRPSRRTLFMSLAAVSGAVISGLVVATAIFILRSHPPRPDAPVGGLRIQADGDGSMKLKPRQPLPCFADGRTVGDLSLAECARRNGVASGPLDVGLEPAASSPAADPIADPTLDPARSLRAVGEFYDALGDADASAAAALVVPERRARGPLSALELKRFYTALRRPLRVTHMESLSANTVFIRYRFIAQGGRYCAGAADVDTTTRGGRTFISRVQALNGC